MLPTLACILFLVCKSTVSLEFEIEVRLVAGGDWGCEGESSAYDQIVPELFVVD